MHYGAYSTDSLMAITNRPDLVFERGEAHGSPTIRASAISISFRAGRSIVSAIARRKLPRR
jgi:hypothetical protein